MTDERQTTTAAEPSTEGDTETPTAPETAAPAPEAEAAAEAQPQAEAAPDGEPDGAAEEPKDEAATETADDGADEAKAEAKAEEPSEEPKAEKPAAEEPKAEEAKAEEATEEPKAEAKGEEETAAAAKAEDAPEEPQTEVKAEEAAEEPKAEAKAEEATAEPKTEAPKAEEAAAEPKVEAKAEDAAAEPKAEAKAEEAAAKPKAEAAAAEASADAGDADAGEGEGDEAATPEIDDPNLIALREAKENGTTVTGKVIGWNRGGFHVVSHEITAFCPSSEMELGRPRSPSGYMDRELDFKVVKFQRKGRRVVLSRTALLEDQRKQILENLKPGTVVQGTVTSLPDFGAFIDLGGIEGLVHVSEISRSRVKRPKDALKLGQDVEVKVMKIENGGERISLSMKELEPDPWKGVAERYPRGSQFTGKILRHADFGMFVELEPDVEGLVHVSQLAPGQEMKAEELKPGNALEGWVREVDTKRQRISLTLREVPEDDPWKTVNERFPEGEMVEGTVESIAPFGVFINLAPGLTGLLPNSQTGLPRGTNAARAFSPGQQVKIQVLQIDVRRKRISLGKEGSQVEATKADLQEFKKQQREQETEAAGAMAAAFAKLRDGN